MPSAGISGLGVGLATVGGFLLYTSIRNVPVLDGLRSALRGEKPAEGPQSRADIRAPTPVGTLATPGESGPVPAASSRILDAARAYLGVPYRWGGRDPRTGFDCSGLVSYVLQHDLGMTGVPRTTYEFLVWKGAKTVPVAQAAPGDLVVWGGHMGIVSRPGFMLDALKRGTVVREDRIWTVPVPTYRRVVV